MATGDVVRLVNEGDSDFTDMYGSRPYVIPAGESLFVEYDAMCLWLGHPEANDFDPRNRVRVSEYHRLRGRYGVDARELEMTLAGVPVESEELFQRLRPRLSAYDTANVQIITVADDPSGDSLSPVVLNVNDDQELLRARMVQLEQETANMRAQLAAVLRKEQALTDAQPITTDDVPDDERLKVGGDGIPGTIKVSESTSTATPASAPRPPARTAPGEDTPTRVRVG